MGGVKFLPCLSANRNAAVGCVEGEILVVYLEGDGP